MSLFLIANGPMPTTAAQVKRATGTAIRTMLQVSLGAHAPARLVEWGCSFDGFAAALPGQVELFETSVAATGLTALATADIVRLDGAAVSGGDPVTNLILVGTNATGFTADTTCTEGTVANARMFDMQLVAPTSQYVKQYPLGREPVIQISKFVRIRMTFGTTVNAYCYMILDI